MPRSSRTDLRNREHTLLAFLWSHTDTATGYAAVSRRFIATYLNASDYQVGYTLRNLDDHGLITIKQRSLQNGVRIENAYVLTEAGAKLLLDLTARHTTRSTTRA